MEKSEEGVISTPYEVWQTFHTKFSVILRDNPELTIHEKKKQAEILTEVFDTYPMLCQRLVPGFNSTQENDIEDYIRCNVWLFGQFVAVFCCEYLESYKTKCLEAQIALLKYIGEKNSLIYHALIRSYICMLEDICKLLNTEDDHFQSTSFEWFQWNSGKKEKFCFAVITYEIRNESQLSEIVNLGLRIFKSQISYLCHTCSAVMDSLWRLTMSLLRDFDSDRSNIYHLIWRLVKENMLLDQEEKFNSITSELLLHIMNDIGKICQMGKIKGEEEFCTLLNVLSERLHSDICYDSAYLNSYYCLVSQCSVSLSESTEEVIFTFFNKLASLSSKNENEADIFAMYYENSLQTINLSLVACILENSIEKQVNQILKNSNKEAKVINVYDSSRKWKLLIEQTSRHVREWEKKNNTVSSKQVVSVLKLVRNITHSAVKACYKFCINVIFFGDEIHRIISSLVKILQIFGSKKILGIFFEILADVLTLSEAKDYDEEKRFFLMSMLSFPLHSFERFGSHMPINFHEKFHRLVDDEIRQLSIMGLMRIRNLEFELKKLLCDEIFLNSCSRVFQALPMLISNFKNYEELELLENILLRANEVVLTEFSPFIRKTICAMDGTCSLLKLPDSDNVEVYCRICDKNVNIFESNSSFWEQRERPNINKIIFKVLSASENACYNVLLAAVKLSNHVHRSEYEVFLKQLHECFSSTEKKILKKIVQISPRIVFKEIIEAERPVQYCFKLSHNMWESFGESLQNVLATSLVNQESDLQYCCINAASKIGCIPIEITLCPSVCLLVNAMLWASCFYSPLAKSCVEQIAKAHNIEEEHIYLKYRENVFPIITHIIVVNFTFYETDLYSLRFDYATVFNALTQCHILKYLLPHAISYGDLQTVIRELADLTQTSVAKMLRYGFRHIFLHAMLFGRDDGMLIKILQLLERNTGEKTSELIGGCVAKVIADLLIHYEEMPEKVRCSILTVRQLLNSQSLTEVKLPLSLLSGSQASINSIMVAFIQHRFFGVMMSLENQLCSDLIPRRTRRQIISSLKCIIQLMGSSYITSVRFKLLLTLRAIISTENAAESPAECVQLWSTFVKTIDPKVLGPISSTIFVSLLPFVKNHWSAVHGIFHYLVVENQNYVSSYLRELYFVEKTECDEIISESIETAVQEISNRNLEDRLQWLTGLCQHEIVEIKLHALKRLKNELCTYHKNVSQLMLASDSIGSLICQILQVLVDGFRNADEKIHEASGLCLGEFGAIDPSYIPNTLIKVDDAKKYTCFGIDDTEFVLNALTVLCRGFQMAKNNAIMDTFALAVQTTLKSYNVTDAESCEIWSKIPKNLREIIQPFHTTTYVLLPSDNESANNIPHLIYSTRNCNSVQKWARSWSHFLISLLPSDSKEKNILQYFKGVISYDNECMLFFLPHILLNAVRCSQETSHKKIYEEMISVIRDDKKGGSKAVEQWQQQSSTQLVVTEQLSLIRNAADMSMDVICVKTVFRLLDVLYKKLRDMRCELNGRESSEFKKLSTFLSKFCKYQLAEKSFERKEYARSLLYMEEYLDKNANNEKVNGGIDKHLAFLAKTYVYLNDVDNVKGLFAVHSVKLRQPQHVIMLHEITDQFQDAAICYQQLLRDCDEERSVLYEKRMISCYLSMNQPEMALRFANSFSTNKAKISKLFDDVKCEALCSLAQYDELEHLTATKSAQLDENWGVRVGQAVVHLLNRDENSLTSEISRIRKSLTKSLHMSSAAFGGYKECYEPVVKLHILNEFEKVASLVFRVLQCSGTNDDVDQIWRDEFQSVIKLEFEERLDKLQPISRVLQPVLNTRQVLFSVASELAKEKPQLVALFNEEIRKCWLKVIEIANRTRNFQLAYSNIVAIDNYQLKGFFIEKAKYYWEKMEQQEALRTLQHGLHYHYKNLEELTSAAKKTTENLEDRKICSEALILIGTYNDAMVNTDFQTNLMYFKDAVKMHSSCEKTLVKLAQYQDKIIFSSSPQELYRTKAQLYAQTVHFYGQSLHYGCEFIYQSLSKMLNIWMDFAAAFVIDKKISNSGHLNERRNAIRDMTKHIENFIKNLPAYYFCTVFTLVMSRISHPLNDCFEKLSNIIIRCILSYPNQILWQFMSLHKTKNRVLQERFNKIIKDSRLSELIPLIKKYQDLFEQFSNLAQSSRKSMQAGNALLTNITKNPILLNSKGEFEDVLIPAQKFLTIILPRSIEDTTNQDKSEYNPFPEKMVYISRIKDQIYVYSSLQKPIRVSLVGTDGLDYPMIFKSNDDMRIDCRCMEFNSVVNTYLKRDPEARDRGLRVRTYTVLPLLDKCGIIEFIPNLQTMRAINLKIRKSYRLPNVPIRQYQCELEDSLSKKKEMFRKLVSLFQPLLHEWFTLEFPNPTSWYAARTAYTRTLAVMSIVGYVVGLGDRHNDNILLDSTNGDIIHVDFNVLFNKGELLAWPERVPFRLTHSMIKAMGPLGYEGGFVCTSEIVNRILRNRKEQLISVLNTFLYDPLEPPPPTPANQHDQTSEKNLSKVEARLNGSVTAYEKATSIPLSVEGQTRTLIKNATDEDNLCQMFIGWSAYM